MTTKQCPRYRSVKFLLDDKVCLRLCRNEDCCTLTNLANLPKKTQLMEDLSWLRTSLRRYTRIKEENMRPGTRELLNFSVHWEHKVNAREGTSTAWFFVDPNERIGIKVVTYFESTPNFVERIWFLLLSYRSRETLIIFEFMWIFSIESNFTKYYVKSVAQPINLYL